jgi:hypothetical protein
MLLDPPGGGHRRPARRARRGALRRSRRARGQILQAQPRLGHRDPAATLREYSYALPLTDRNVADATDAHLDQPVNTDATRAPQKVSDPTFCRAADGA